ncbi:iron chaperone [Opitutales bacterium ASA1]|uniref:iron chaperone n=1 Tax=Congregicoccus parvus TaxID=3081749 RepID=UPI002B2E74B6|nr:iron chaperone [Opitutales bacterium ASA1]
MQSTAPTIAAYLASLPDHAHAVLEPIDALIRRMLPSATGSMKYGMPTFELGKDRYLAYNAQKNYFSLYVDPTVVARHKSLLKGLDVGKSCIRFRRADQLPLETVEVLLADLR